MAEQCALLSISEMINRLLEMNKNVLTDERNNKYCQYLQLFLSHFGQERCMVVGSTQEGTRLRLKKDKGDCDILVISEIVIPTEALEYREDLPCFVYIDGLRLKDKFQTVELIDDKYLPSVLLSEIRPEAFKHITDFYQIFSKFRRKRKNNRMNVVLDHKIKPGKTLVTYKAVECSELEMKNQKRIDSHKIYKHFRRSLTKATVEGKHGMLSKMGKLVSVVKQFTNIDLGTTEYKSYFLETFGPFIDSVAANVENSLPQNRRLDNTDQTLPLLCESDDAFTENMRENTKPRDSDIGDICSNNENGSEEKGSFQNIETTHDTVNDIILKYSSKFSMDFIPAFALSSKPSFLENWKNRERKWPPKQVIEDIYNSEFFVVAKPALTKQDVPKDFCLAFNFGEINLARVFTPVQKKVVLIIKAFKSTLLSKYSEILTTFHWKTALYLMSEHHLSIFSDTTDNVLSFLSDVVTYMMDCLLKKELQHFFIPSNLFAGMDQRTCSEIAIHLQKINENPVSALRKFFDREEEDDWKYEQISKVKVMEFRQSYNDPKENCTVEIIVNFLKRFSKEKEETIREAIRDVLTVALPFFINEMAMARSAVKINATILQNIISNNINKGRLIDTFINYWMNIQSKEELDADDIAKDFLALIVKEARQH